MSISIASLSLLALTGCGSGGLAGEEGEETQTSAPQQKGLAELDPCSVFKPDDLKQFRLEGPGEPIDNIKSEPGCSYNGDAFTVTVYRNAEMTVDSYGKQDNWARFDETKVNGRQAATAIDSSATQARLCMTMFDVGSGVVMVDATESRDKGLDECAESKKIAEAIEPRMPK